MNHFEFLETTARAAGHQVRRLRHDLPRGRSDELLGTLETLISAAAATAHACRGELKLLRAEIAVAQVRIESLEKAARAVSPRPIRLGETC